jgi:hypothetical protein
MNSPLSKRYLGLELPLEVLCANGRYFIGATMPRPPFEPASRDSLEYYRTRGDAQAALDSGSFTQRPNP